MASAPSRKQLHVRFHMIKALVLLAFMVVVGWAEPPLVDYTFQLSHVDANRGFSSDELMHRAANRSRLRAATMYSAHAVASAASDPTQSSSPDIKLPGGVCWRVAEYYVKFYVGEAPMVPTTAVMDTGSNLIWTTQRRCSMMDPEKLLPCSDGMCHHANCACNTKKNYCEFDVAYGDRNGITVKGLLYKDVLAFLLASGGGVNTKSVELALGCSTSTGLKGCSPEIGGIVGMGRGPQSLPEQLKATTFSYCLNDYSKPDLPSKLLFKTFPDLTKGKRSGADVVTATLGRHPGESWYFVHLEDISIDGTPLHIPAFNPPDDGAAGNGNMFIDSGASYTSLEEEAFNKVVEKIDEIMKLKGHDKSSDNSNICYSGGTKTGLPKMVLHFHESAGMELSWESYLWQYKTSMCLTIRKGKTGSYRVLGNYQQQGIHMLFDTKNDKLQFVQADCSKVA